MAPTRSAVALLAIGVLSLTSCGGDDSDPAAKTGGGGAATAQPAVAGDPDTWPLTGLPVAGSGSSVQRRPVLVVKMDNTASSAPQRGLSEADLVVEELVEGGLTRLAAFYYSQVPKTVGPVRSMRASDIGIVAPAAATVVTSGAAPVTIRLIRAADISFVGEGSPGFYRDSGRRAPYNLMAGLDDVADSTKQRPGRPADYLDFGDADDLPRGEKAVDVTARFSGGHATTWRYRDGHYDNLGTYAAKGEEFAADNVLVLRVEVGDAGYRDPAGNPVPRTKLTGTGPALLLHGGKVVRVRWSKKHLDEPLHLTTAEGDDVAVPRGRTWIELVPTSGGVEYH